MPEEGFSPIQAMMEANRCLMCADAPCTCNCPAGVDARAFIRKIRFDNLDGAVRLLKQANVLSASCALICPTGASCARECVAKELLRPIDISGLQRYVMDYEMCRGMIEPLNSPKKKSRVAIVGAGPAGLGCAAELAVRGHNVKVFDREEKPGGMLRYYIPNYRLPDEILDFEIDFIKKLGVEFEMKSEIENLESLKKDFDAVYIATGLHKSRGGDLKGVEKKNCYMALDFLRMANASKLPKLGNRVCVIGGGDTAMDAAQVSKKSGAESFVLYRRPQDKMPAYKNEIEASWNMGVEFYFRVLPCEIVGKDRVEGVKCVRVKWHKSLLGKGEKYDIENEEFTIACDTVVIAIGQGTESIFGLKQSKEGLLQIDSETFRTSENGIYAGGDMVQGGGTAARAVGMGKLAATKIDEYLK